MDCSFCSRAIPMGMGTMYVKKDGKIFYLCSSKCEKHILKLGHTARTTRWTGDAHKNKAKETKGASK